MQTMSSQSARHARTDLFMRYSTAAGVLVMNLMSAEIAGKHMPFSLPYGRWQWLLFSGITAILAIVGRKLILECSNTPMQTYGFVLVGFGTLASAWMAWATWSLLLWPSAEVRSVALCLQAVSWMMFLFTVAVIFNHQRREA